METKTCCDCMEVKAIARFNRKGFTKDGTARYGNRCGECRYKRYSNTAKKYQAENSDRLVPEMRKRAKKYSEQLTDNYVISQIEKRMPELSREEIKNQPQLIIAVRMRIKLKRTLRKQKNGKKK